MSFSLLFTSLHWPDVVSAIPSKDEGCGKREMEDGVMVGGLTPTFLPPTPSLSNSYILTTSLTAFFVCRIQHLASEHHNPSLEPDCDVFISFPGAISPCPGAPSITDPVSTLFITELSFSLDSPHSPPPLLTQLQFQWLVVVGLWYLGWW